MLAFANVLDLLAHEFARLCRGRLSLRLVSLSPLNGFFFRHDSLRGLCVQERRLQSVAPASRRRARKKMNAERRMQNEEKFPAGFLAPPGRRRNSRRAPPAL